MQIAPGLRRRGLEERRDSRNNTLETGEVELRHRVGMLKRIDHLLRRAVIRRRLVAPPLLKHHLGAPEKVVYPLEHAYSVAELDFASLKGVDAAVAALLKSAAPQAGCYLHLALVSIEESGSAEDTGSYLSHYRRYDDAAEPGGARA